MKYRVKTTWTIWFDGNYYKPQWRWNWLPIWFDFWDNDADTIIFPEKSYAEKFIENHKFKKDE